MKIKTKSILLSLASLLAAGSVLAGSTYAFFSLSTEGKINISFAKVNVDFTLEITKASSFDQDIEHSNNEVNFINGGSVKLDKNNVTINKLSYGDSLTLKVTPTNNSNIKIKYRNVIELSDKLKDILNVYINDTLITSNTIRGDWKEVDIDATIDDISYIKLEGKEDILTTELDSGVIKVLFEAVQANADLRTFEETGVNEYSIFNLEGLEEFRDSVDKGNTYQGKVIKLENDIDNDYKVFDPIGYNVGVNETTKVFDGTFDGNNHTISNLYFKNDLEKSNVGLFASTDKNAVIKNLNVDGVKNDLSYRFGTIVGNSIPSTTIENVHVSNINITANRQSGGIIGSAYGLNLTNSSATNINIKMVQDNFSGNYDNGDKAGGLIGQLQSDSNHTIKNNVVENITLTGVRDMGLIVGNTMYYTQGSKPQFAVIENNTLKGTNVITIDERLSNDESGKYSKDVGLYYGDSKDSITQEILSSILINNKNESETTFNIINKEGASSTNSKVEDWH